MGVRNLEGWATSRNLQGRGPGVRSGLQGEEFWGLRGGIWEVILGGHLMGAYPRSKSPAWSLRRHKHQRWAGPALDAGSVFYLSQLYFTRFVSIY